MSKLTKLRNASYAPLGEWAYQEITTLRTQLAEAQAEVQEQARLNDMGAEREAKLMAQLAEVARARDDYKQAVDDLGLTPEEARAGAKRSRDMKQQLLATQAQLAEVSAQRNASNRKIEELTDQLLATQAHAARLTRALNVAAEKFHDYAELHSLKEPTPENKEKVERNLLLSRMCDEALSTPINLDALHEDRAEFIDDVAKRLLTEVCFKMGSGSPYRKMLHDYINTLREQAAAHRAKKESK